MRLPFVARFLPILVVAAVPAVRPARAQPTTTTTQAGGSGANDADLESARAAVRSGLEAADAGDHERALASFRRAIELVPEANLPHRHAARSLEALSRWEEAIVEYETYLRIKADVSDAAAVRLRIEELRSAHATGTVELACRPVVTSVLVDGVPVTIDASRSVRLRAGRHELRLRAAGYQEKRLDVDVEAGEVARPECALAQVPASVRADPGAIVPGRRDSAEAAPERRVWYTQWWAWAGAGALAAGVTVATILVVSSGQTSIPPSEGGDHRFP